MISSNGVGQGISRVLFPPPIFPKVVGSAPAPEAAADAILASDTNAAGADGATAPSATRSSLADSLAGLTARTGPPPRIAAQSGDD